MIFMEYIAFPNKGNKLLLSSPDNVKNIISEASGSNGLLISGKCHKTYPNETYNVNKRMDWCSNFAKPSEPKPWISYSLKNKAMKLSGYSIRNGCCSYDGCCIEDGRGYDYRCCCRLYSFALQGSNDNRTWKEIHKVDKDDKFFICESKTYEFPETESYRFVRIALIESYPYCPICLQINQVEFYGKTVDVNGFIESEDEGDESVSIIGKINEKKDY